MMFNQVYSRSLQATAGPTIKETSAQLTANQEIKATER